MKEEEKWSKGISRTGRKERNGDRLLMTGLGAGRGAKSGGGRRDGERVTTKDK